MHMTMHPAVLVFFLLTTVAAQDIIPREGSGFHAPPLENANLGFYSLLLIATFIQVICAVTYLFRGRSPHLPPGIVAIVAFIILGISYALGIAIVVADWTFDEFSERIVFGQALLDIDIPTDLFFEWVDPAMFAVVALVLRDRYRTYTNRAEQTTDRPLPLLPFTLITWLLIAVLVILTSASIGLFGAAYTALYSTTEFISDEQLHSEIKESNNLGYAFVAFVIITTVFLLVFAIVVRKRARGDKIASLTLFWIMPVLGARALARLIFEIINARLPLSSSWTDNDAYALDLASTIVYGVLHFIVACVLVHFFMNPRLWFGPDEHYGYPPQPQFYPQGGMQPVAQFPGQWGYTGQPQNYPVTTGMNGEYSYPPGVAPQQTHMAYPPHAASSPDVEKTQEGVSPNYGSQTTPLPAS